MPSLNTPYATLSFQNLTTPRARAEGADAVYSCTLIFDQKAQKSDAYKAMVNAVTELARKEFGPKANIKAILEAVIKDAGTKDYEGFEQGHTFINPWSKNKPGVVDRNREDVLLPEEIWSGQLVRANISPFAWKNSGKMGVSFGLNHVQIIDTDRPRLDGRPTARSAFDDGEVSETAPF